MLNSISNKSTLFSIVMTYYNRRKQILNTLNNFQTEYKSKNYNFEVIIVDDNSIIEEQLHDIPDMYSFPIKYILIDSNEKGDRVNPGGAYNKGFAEASGDIVIIQNSECYHIGDILKHCKENLTENDYFSYSCFAGKDFDNSDKLLSHYKLNKNTFSFKLANSPQKAATMGKWYNHPVIRPVGYHFCSAIYRSKLELIGGFNKKFNEGYCFDDDVFLMEIKYNLKLNIRIIPPNSVMVIHQYYPPNKATNITLASDSSTIKKKWIKNKQLYSQLKEHHEMTQFNYPKLLHLYWDGSPLSFLHYLTVVSFLKYNPEWKIVLYRPLYRTLNKTWKSNENKKQYTEKCYLNTLYNNTSISVITVDFAKIGFYNEASEVIKSDYLRYWALYTHGGMYSDLDILYTGSIKSKMNFSSDIVLFACEAPIHQSMSFIYFPIACFLCKKNTKFMKILCENAIKYYNPNYYQCIGATMLNTLFDYSMDVKNLALRLNKRKVKNWTHDCYFNHKNQFIFADASGKVPFSNILWSKHIKYYNYINLSNIIARNLNISESIKICDSSYYLPVAYNQMELLLDNKYTNKNNFSGNNVGIHWFNGHNIIKTYLNNLSKRLLEGTFSINCYIDKLVEPYKNLVND